MDETQDEAAIIRIGEEAVRAVRQTFERWLEVARALEIGRHWAMSDTGANEPVGRRYNEAFGAWLQRHPVFAELKESTRTWLYKCYEHRHAILKWREQRGAGEMTRYNYPETVFKRWDKAVNPKAVIADADEPSDKPQRPSAAQLQHELEAAHAHIAELETAAARLRDERNQLIDLEWDSIDNIAATLRSSKRWSEIRSALSEPDTAAPVVGNVFHAVPSRRKSKYPFAELEVGESFTIEGQKQSSVGARASNTGKQLGRNFSTKRIDDWTVQVTRTM